MLFSFVGNTELPDARGEATIKIKLCIPENNVSPEMVIHCIPS